MKYKTLALALFLLVMSCLSFGQGILPEPTLIDHQIVTNLGQDTFTATENIQSYFNLVVISVTCGWYSGGSYLPCVGIDSPTDQSGATWSKVERHYNTTHGWTQEEWWAVIDSTGSDVITLATGYHCTTCTWYAMVQQIQGIEADTQ